MKLNKFLITQSLFPSDPLVVQFKEWLGPDADRSYYERIWLAIFEIFKRRNAGVEKIKGN